MEQHMATKREAKEAQAKAFSELLDRAYAAADRAQAGLRENPNAFDCGFAWVTVDPSNHAFVMWCKAQLKGLEGPGGNRDHDARRRYGSKGYPTGWQFWCPGSFHGQSMPIHEAGARAFRDVLALAPGMGGARVSVGSRYD
jgi:hypothetical protein